ncbi:methionine--tRNA ligase, cytoplasmic [Prorops nasuta]|uniref:methionine--tRNA ligase, cytoplasmic n=1 Tax=Prorops nasuta TaxID=863751 RepID=UPI0034CE5F60
MIVLTNKGNPNALKLIIAAKVASKSLPVKFVETNESFLHRLPVLKLDSGSEIFSVSAASLFISEASEEYIILNNKWLELDVSLLQPAILSFGASGTETNEPSLIACLKEINKVLKNQQYLSQDNTELSVADISIWVTLWSTVANTGVVKNFEMSVEYPIVWNWLLKIEKLPFVQEALEEYKFEKGVKAISSIQEVSWFPINSITNMKSKPLSDISQTKEKENEAVTGEEMKKIGDYWFAESYPDVKKPTYPVLPKKGEKNVLITSALPYVNNVPHLGNIIGCVLSADIFARYCRQRNYNTLYICGTDEYGTATEAKALEEKMTPQQICDKFFSIHNDIYRWFSIGFDYFGRTTIPEQTEIVQSFFLRIKSQGYVQSDSVDQLLCEKCDRFLADRFVEGMCPRCKYEDARGDQCDGCGHLVNATDLVNPRCKVCHTRPIIKKSQQFFLDLPKVEEKLKKFVSTSAQGWSSVARAVTKPWLRDGLKARCITRDLKWGIPVPVEGFEKKVFYVWFDAPLGYISITKKYTKDYRQWWQPQDKDISLYQFMAKDNVPFHAIMFPACLLAADQNYTLIKHLMATEYLNYEDTKFSKSRGIGVFGTDAKETGISSDVWRFYLAYIRPETQDSNFNWVDLATKNNSELLNNFGNFVNRALVFAERYFDSKVPVMELQEDDLALLALCQRELTSYISSLEQAKLRDGLRHVLAISKHGNQYMQFQQPWVKVKGNESDKMRAGTIIGVCCNLACLLSALLGPFMPNVSRELRDQLGMDNRNYGFIPDSIINILKAGHKIGKPSPLFTKIEDAQVEMLRKKYAGKQENNVSSDKVAALDQSIEKQAALVRELKAKEDKSVWKPQVDILLELKLKRNNMIDPTVQEAPVKNKKAQSNSEKHVPVSQQNGGASTDVASLEAAIAKQGALVRELKAKAEKSVWQPEVETLLNLKKELAQLTGNSLPVSNDKKSKKKK